MDKQRNKKVYLAGKDFPELTFEVFAPPEDNDYPVLESVTVSPQTITPGATVTITVKATDAVSGLADGWTGLFSPSRISSSGGIQLKRVDENTLAGEYTFDPGMIAYRENGLWTLRNIGIRDRALNGFTYQYGVDYQAGVEMSGGLSFPTADAGPDLYAREGEELTLRCSASDPDGYIVSREWHNFTTGEIIGEGREVKMRYPGYAEMRIGLIVTDNDGATAVDSMRIYNRMFLDLRQADMSLKQQIDDIELCPGPQGPAGPCGTPGPPGPKGDPGVTPEELEEIREDIARIKQMLKARPRPIRRMPWWPWRR